MARLRLTVAPVLDRMIRAVLPPLEPAFRKRLLVKLTRPDPVPASAAHLPFGYPVQPMAVQTIAAELRSFNAGMINANPRVGRSVPVVALLAGRDTTAEPSWHGPWLKERKAWSEFHLSSSWVGHLIHHLRPAQAWAAIYFAISRGEAGISRDNRAQANLRAV